MSMDSARSLVIIGRNEGERLRRCLESAAAQFNELVYVDSGSTDGSVELAAEFGAIVVSLDLSMPFTAARARNAGAKAAQSKNPQLKWIQFVDGDCELVSDWPDKAVAFLTTNEEYAVVCGRRRERFPRASVYNRLCDLEWDTPVGETRSCGGDAMMRVHALDEACGYREDLIAGEEPELCFRLRQRGWRIWRLDADMTLHDAAMSRFSQWWQRAKRSGYAYAHGAWLHGRSPERFNVRECLRIAVWALGLPVAVFLATVVAGWWGLLLILVYPLQILRLALQRSDDIRWPWAASMVICKFAELMGIARFLKDRLFNRSAILIEYKGAK